MTPRSETSETPKLKEKHFHEPKKKFVTRKFTSSGLRPEKVTKSETEIATFCPRHLRVGRAATP